MNVSSSRAPLPTDGLVVFVRRDCPTCALVEPVLRELAERGKRPTIVSQDDPAELVVSDGVVDDRGLELCFRYRIEIVPTFIRLEGGREAARTFGWDRAQWEAIAGISGIGIELPGTQPGCGSRSVEPGIAETLAARFGERGSTRGRSRGRSGGTHWSVLRSGLDRRSAGGTTHGFADSAHAAGHPPGSLGGRRQDTAPTRRVHGGESRY